MNDRRENYADQISFSRSVRRKTAIGDGLTAVYALSAHDKAVGIFDDCLWAERLWRSIMKTDLDFIKDKFENSGVDAPENMGKDFALEKIAEATPEKPKKITAVKGLSIAAAVALVTVTAFGVTSIIGNTPKPASFSGKASLKSFNNKSEVRDALKKVFDETKKRNDYFTTYEKGNIVYKNDLADDSISGAMKKNALSSYVGDANGSKTHNTTYVQETGVDEADTVKTDGDYIYYLCDNKINIFSAEGKKSKLLSSITPKKKSERFFNDFYLHDNKVIAVSQLWSNTTRETEIDVYDISDINNIKLNDSYAQSGDVCSTRMIGDKIYVVSFYNADREDDYPRCGNISNSATPDEIAPTDIYCPEKPSESTFLVVSEIDTAGSEKKTKSKAILGSADEIYCNTENLYVTAKQYEYPEAPKPKTSTDDEVNFYYTGLILPTVTATQIVKIDLNNGLDFTATAKVEGYIDNQYSLDEKDGCLRVAVTKDKNDSGNRIQSNTLYVLDKNLKQLGKTNSFAENESIKAVRYIGDTAYVITYEETDPLFVIDTSDSSNPKILGEVKISGFSTMLVPVDENTLLGIGYHAQDEDYTDLEVQEGLKLALFDVSDKADPKVLDEMVFKDYNSPVQYDPKALVVNYERNDYAIPFSFWNYNDETEDSESREGALNFKVENGKLKLIDEYASEMFGKDTDTVYSGIDRCTYVGDFIYLLGSENDYSSELEEYKQTAIIDAVEYK